MPEADGFRNMADPEEDDDPDHYSELDTGSGDNGGVHTNSGIPNHAFYLLVNGGQNASCASQVDHDSAHCSGDGNLTVTGIDQAQAEQIFFLGFNALGQSATMEDARGATEAAADTMFGEASQQLQSVSDAWTVVGVGVAGCTVTETPEVSCGDGVDNDCDGDTDGADADCSICTPTETPESTCDDGLDNDCDGLFDSDDSDCPVDACVNPGGAFPGVGCFDDIECCSNKCKGKPDDKTCK